MRRWLTKLQRKWRLLFRTTDKHERRPARDLNSRGSKRRGVVRTRNSAMAASNKRDRAELEARALILATLLSLDPETMLKLPEEDKKT